MEAIMSKRKYKRNRFHCFVVFCAVFGFALASALSLYAGIGTVRLGTSFFGKSFLDLHKTSTFWGIAVSAVALVITCYFVILAKEAHRMEREISKSINDMISESKEKLETLFSESRGRLETLFSECREQLERLEELYRNLEASGNNLAISLWDSYTMQYNQYLYMNEDEN